MRELVREKDKMPTQIRYFLNRKQNIGSADMLIPMPFIAAEHGRKGAVVLRDFTSLNSFYFLLFCRKIEFYNKIYRNFYKVTGNVGGY